MESWNDRTEKLIGAEGVGTLSRSSVLVVGLGGVGGYAAEMLARSGVGHLSLLDADNVDITNVNRQLIALQSNVGERKVSLFANRFLDINPEIEVKEYPIFLTPDNVEEIVGKEFDFVVDAIDTVAPKVALISYCLTHSIPVISSMGAGGRLNPSRVGVRDLWETREDGLARAVRTRLKRAGLRRRLPVVASDESPRSSSIVEVNTENKRTSYGTIAMIPSLFGIYMASYVVQRLVKGIRSEELGTPKG